MLRAVAAELAVAVAVIAAIAHLAALATDWSIYLWLLMAYAAGDALGNTWDGVRRDIRCSSRS